jgi:MFS transporter, PHS family, inorganic phosphate transporter
MSAVVHKTSGGNAAFHNFHNDYAHIADPNERRRLALAEIDKAPFGWYHIRAIVVAGIGFFTDAYEYVSVCSLRRLTSCIDNSIVSLPSTWLQLCWA